MNVEELRETAEKALAHMQATDVVNLQHELGTGTEVGTSDDETGRPAG